MIWYVLGMVAVLIVIMVYACLVVGARYEGRDKDE